ncbi:MAG: restriction endonuclease subunit S [Gammaproteobacteria bacterium]|jgi:type I restriction enzyme S subunit|nr:restriction endonuclease subunit S [Gammaproteobacteria bacterium]MBP6479449.1 restriction endonuclease subunit S [Pseudomonadales bacterium]MBP7909611.1 restriction endonuclease subunit S [Pseudomonadales bacterium]
MSFPRYAAYRDSGVAWLREVPEHWGVMQSRRMFSVRSEPAQPSDQMLTASQRYGVIFQKDFVEMEGRRVVEVIMGKESLKHVEPNDFIISMRSFQGGLEWSRLRGSTSFHYVMVKPVKCVHPPFFAHLFKSAPYIEALRSTTDLIRDGQELRYSNFVQVSLPVVPSEEQAAIAAFLDRETAKIDALVEAQKRLIELLKEKRQAVISQAVTKGLDPNVPMKDSGVEWLGEVPEHWVIGAIKRFCKVLDGRRIPLSAQERGSRSGDIPYYGASGIIDWIDEHIFDEDLVLVSEDGANLLNRSTPIAFVVRGKYWVNNHAHILKPMDQNLIFWAERIETIDLRPFVTGSAQPKLTIEALANVVIAVPSDESERSAIESYIVQEVQRLDELVLEANTARGLLLERRSALISAAVTGKIDVRGLVSQPEPAAA